MSRPIGIDLGTTYSSVAVVGSDGRPAIVSNREGENITPSVVLFQGDSPLVGSLAKRSAALSPHDCIQSVKRYMGDPSWRFRSSSGATFTPEQISAIIVKRLRVDAELRLGEEIPRAVITVPAYFDDARRCATRDAGRIAGLEVMRVINEPTAAALAYGLGRGYTGNILVYDLGGGTFDVTLMRIEGGRFTVLSTSGDRNLGGNDWDDALMQWVRERVLAGGGQDLFEDDLQVADLREKCELAKRTLSTVPAARVFVSSHGRSHDLTIERSDFERLTKPLLHRTRLLMEEALQEATLSWKRLDRVLLVGGSTRMPMVQQLVRDLTGHVPDMSINPDEAVALGAAIQAHLIDSEQRGEPVLNANGDRLSVHDVTSQSLGVVILGDQGDLVNSVIIEHNTPIPCKHGRRYATVVDSQRQLRIQVTEGNDEDLEFVRIVGESELEIPSYGAGAPVEVVFSYDIDGIIHVEVIDGTSGKNLGEFEIDREANLGGETVTRMRKEMEDLSVT